MEKSIDSFDLDALIGKKITKSFVLQALNLDGIEQAIFKVEDLYLVVSVTPDSDELMYTITPEVDFDTLDGSFKRKQLSNQQKKITWIWRLTNSNGYNDGLQIELDGWERTNVQLLAEASQLTITVFNRA